VKKGSKRFFESQFLIFFTLILEVSDVSLRVLVYVLMIAVFLALLFVFSKAKGRGMMRLGSFYGLLVLLALVDFFLEGGFSQLFVMIFGFALIASFLTLLVFAFRNYLAL